MVVLVLDRYGRLARRSSDAGVKGEEEQRPYVYGLADLAEKMAEGGSG
jgi:hypothetical protein